MSIWIAKLWISDRTAHKLSTRHGVQADEVIQAVQCVRGLQFVWDEDDLRRRRAIVRVKIRGAWVLVVLYPRKDADDEWNLGSAYRD